MYALCILYSEWFILHLQCVKKLLRKARLYRYLHLHCEKCHASTYKRIVWNHYLLSIYQFKSPYFWKRLLDFLHGQFFCLNSLILLCDQKKGLSFFMREKTKWHQKLSNIAINRKSTIQYKITSLGYAIILERS